MVGGRWNTESRSDTAGREKGLAPVATNDARNVATRQGGQSMTPTQLRAHLDLRNGSRSSRHVRADRKGTRAARTAAAARD